MSEGTIKVSAGKNIRAVDEMKNMRRSMDAVDADFEFVDTSMRNGRSVAQGSIVKMKLCEKSLSGQYITSHMILLLRRQLPFD